MYIKEKIWNTLKGLFKKQSDFIMDWAAVLRT